MEKIMIHVRFVPNGSVVEVSDRPAGLTPQDWFNLLSDRAGDVYQTFSGGRGLFRIDQDKLEALKAEVTSTAA
ncbi:hypothetical protein V5F77_03175 [Xanthobacter sp. DSM 24535]|uniref:hypothetical protein n=1 Tax=Roseixanthobacter psychrophilus TaxID=3119917 RepID=UPI0037286310